VSELRRAAEDYLTIRRGLGFKLTRQGELLRDFVGWCERSGVEVITLESALAWAMQPTTGTPIWKKARLSVVRGFTLHLRNLEARTEVPPADLLPAPKCRATPFLYSATDVDNLREAAKALKPDLRAATYETLIGLLAVTGIRIGELCRLERQDVDWEDGVLTIRLTKFNKSRDLPVHHTTLDALRRYQVLRDELCSRPTRSNALFVSIVGTQLLRCDVDRTFHSLVRKVGLESSSAGRRPRLHDLRHSFAVHTLLDWYRTEADVQAKLPLLSTYLGHVDPASTYWYLSATPELLGLVGERLTALGQSS
jgi:integrase/recombinase XerD